VAGSCEHGNELSGSIKGGAFLDLLRNYQLLGNDSAPCSKLDIIIYLDILLIKTFIFYISVSSNTSFTTFRHLTVTQSITSRPALGLTLPPIQRVLGTFTPVVKRPGRESEISFSSNAKVIVWGYTSSPQQVFMVWCLIKQEIRIHGVVFS
jgi:hypothetical protein